MKIKLSWVLFIPIALLSVFLRVYQISYVDTGIDNGFFSSDMLWVIYACMVTLLFLFLIIINAIDRKTSGFYTVGKNFFAGIFAIASAVMLGFGAGNQAMSLMQGEFSAILAVDTLLSVIAGVAFFVIGFASLFGRNRTQNMKVLMAAPSVWSCVRLVYFFMESTTQSVHVKDMTNIIFMAFATLFLFHASMVYSGIKGRNPVKGSFLYGMPAIVLIFAYSAAYIVSAINSGENGSSFLMNGSMDSVNAVQYFFIALFALFFLIELTSKAKKKTQQELAKVSEEREEVSLPAATAVRQRRRFADVDSEVKEELNQVDHVIADIDHEAKNPDKADPLSDEFMNNYGEKSSTAPKESIDDDIEKINRLISELEDEKK